MYILGKEGKDRADFRVERASYLSWSAFGGDSGCPVYSGRGKENMVNEWLDINDFMYSCIDGSVIFLFWEIDLSSHWNLSNLKYVLLVIILLKKQWLLREQYIKHAVILLEKSTFFFAKEQLRIDSYWLICRRTLLHLQVGVSIGFNCGNRHRSCTVGWVLTLLKCLLPIVRSNTAYCTLCSNEKLFSWSAKTPKWN